MENPNNIFNKVNPKKIDVPEGDYFKQMANSIIANQNATPKIIPLYKKPVFWITSVAATIILIIVFNMNANNEKTFNIQLALNEVSSEEIISYVDENIDEFELSEITDAIPESKIDLMEKHHTNSSENETNLSFENISEEEIIEYLLDEDVELDELFI